MKKVFKKRTSYLLYVIIMLTLLPSNSVAQDLEFDYSEATYDAAYEAPTSLITGKWVDALERTDYYYIIINSNNTVKNVMTSSKLGGLDISTTMTIPGTWKRNKGTITFTWNNTKAIFTYDKAALSKYPLRKQDACKKIISDVTTNIKKLGIGKEKLEILRVDDKVMVLGENKKVYNENVLLATKNFRKEK